MLKYLTDWTISLAGRKASQYWLALIAFIENSVFPIPTDVLFIPMILAKPQKAWYYAWIATIFSIAGGIAGWLLGYFAYETVGKAILQFYGKYDEFEYLRSKASFSFVCLLLILSGVTHLPPIKIVTILSGVFGINLWIFIALSLISRGARFYFLAWLLYHYGAFLLEFIEKRIKSVFVLIALTIFLIFVGYHCIV